MSETFKSSIFKHLGSITVAIGVVITALVLGNSWVKSKRNFENKKSIEVTGKAEKDFISDLVVGVASTTGRAQTLKRLTEH